jgi:hypothetical protein
VSKGTHQVYGPSQVLGTNSCTFLCMPWLVATIHREGSEEVPPPYPQGECPMITMPPNSTPTAPEVPTQDPRPGVSDTPKIHQGARRRVWVAVLCLIAMTMGTFLMLKSGKFFDRVFPPSTPEEFNRSGVSAAVLREWKNARADHEAIALTVAQCLDLGDAYGHAGFLNKQLMLDLQPTGDRLRYAGAKEDLTAKPLKLTSFQRGAIYLSDTITRERIERAGVISHHYRVMNGLNMAIIIIGAITTTLISVKATASGDQVKNLLYQIIGITAIFLSAFGTIASGLNSFYNPQGQYTQHQKSLEMLKQLHVEVASAVSSQDVDRCRAPMAEDYGRKVKDWSARLASILNASETTAQSGKTPPGHDNTPTRPPGIPGPDNTPGPGTPSVPTTPVSDLGKG